ncbi:MAG: hypothetical protein KAI47_12430, partial [Deltaproteobacteria bacterium]|nr:hypothetical protein [Deltaproteobacteria bacterium]
YGIAAVCVALALNACSDDTTNPIPPKHDGPVVLDDTGVGQEGIILPDGNGQSDTTVEPPKCDAALLGKTCTKEGQECGDGTNGMTCLLTSDTQGGVCGCQCTPDDANTKLVNEDTCPDLSANACGSVELQDGSTLNLCFHKCAPKLGSNDCNAPLVCEPRSGVSVGLFDTAVCAFHGCAADTDCPVITSKTCKTDGSVACDTGDKCLPLEEGGADGLCTKPGKCDTASGLCAPRTANMLATAKVGDVCKDDTECAGNMKCEREMDMATIQKAGGEACTAASDCCSGSCNAGTCKPGTCTLHARNGYCYVAGCAFSSFTAYQCPTGSICNTLYSGGLCMKSCELAKAESCRGNATDKLGDYECRAWNNISLGGVAAAAAPVCEFADNFACDVFATLDCPAFGEQGNPTNMVCRDIKTGAKLTNGKDPMGFCLDDTASGVAP